MPRKKRDVSQILLKALEGKLGITRRGLNTRIQSTKNKYGAPLMDDEVAICLLCSEENIDLKKKEYADPNKGYAVPTSAIEEAYRIQTTVTSTKALTQAGTAKADKKRITEKSLLVNRLGNDPILPDPKLNEAARMALEVYPYLYVLENSIRHLIIIVMQDAYPGKDWWNKPGVIPDHGDAKVKSRVERIMEEEEEKPWPGRKGPGTEPIYYTYLWHLREIIIHNGNWPFFKPILKKKDFVRLTINEVMTCRNNIMHCNPLQPGDIKVVKYRLEQWHRVLRNAIASKKIPNH